MKLDELVGTFPPSHRVVKEFADLRAEVERHHWLAGEARAEVVRLRAVLVVIANIGCSRLGIGRGPVRVPDCRELFPAVRDEWCPSCLATVALSEEDER